MAIDAALKYRAGNKYLLKLRDDNQIDNLFGQHEKSALF
jgi:hypothetical protein